MKKFEDKRISETISHWADCEREKVPYISITEFNQKYDEIFYDITNLSYDLEEVSEKIKAIYKSYIDFFQIPYFDVANHFEQYYFFRFLVLKSHSEIIAKQLFTYLIENEIQK